MTTAQFLDILCDPNPARACPPVMVIVAHPDDETVGAGSRLPRLRDALFVHVTDGAPQDLADAHSHGLARREEYAAVRRRELHAALEAAGLSREQSLSLGIIDQEASFYLADLSERIAALLVEWDPCAVLTHPYEGGHPDHDAVAFAVQMACGIVADWGRQPPVRLEMTSYHNVGGSICTYEFLPGYSAAIRTVTLSQGERQLKKRLLDCYASQQETLRYFPVAIERFRPAPLYDFSRPPHDGMLFYECFPWGMTGDRFRDLAVGAVDRLYRRQAA